MNPELQFAHSAWIWIGLATCVALAFGMARWNRRRDRDLERLAHARLLRQLTASVSRKRRIAKQALWLMALFLVFVAVARPQYGFEYREVKRRGIDIVFAVDTSRSMLAEDVVPNRLERAKLAITDFVEKLNGDRVGLIPFAGNAFSLCPLTLDYDAFFQSLDALDTNIIPHQGTDLATAVEEANRLFDKEGNNHRILILITDGEDLQGAVMDAVASAKEKGMTIHTVGVGDPAGALIPLTQPDGSQDFVRDQNGEPVKTALDEATLKQIATATGGIYAPLGNAGQGLETIYQEKLRLVPKSELNQRLDRIPLERFEWPLAAAILLLFFEFLMGDRRRKPRRTTPVISVARRKVATAILLLAGILLPAWNAVAADLPDPNREEADHSATPTDFTDPRAAYNAGTSAYQSGDFAQAEQTLSQTLSHADDLSLQQRSYYNLGNARYRLGQESLQQDPKSTIAKWEEAVKSYDDALALNPGDEDAKFNREFVQKKLEELKEQQQQSQQNQSSQDQKQNQDQSSQSSDSQDQGQSDDQKQQDQNSGSESDSQDQQSSENQQKAGDQSQDNPEKADSGQDSEKDQSSEGKDDKEQQEQPSESDSKDGGQNSEDSKPEQESKPGEEKPEDSQAGSSGDQAEPAKKPEKSPATEAGKPSDSKDQPSPTQSPKPQAGPTEDPQGEEKAGQPGTLSEERREPGEMSREEAAQLLEALQNDERSVIPLPASPTNRRATPNNTVKGKTW
ncbi:MAG: VWA domain-containing protein [Verrucomicrobiae bacterium]|nr:VWA domain-containing protein [Verrucomicrobiae bacterium]